MKKIEITIPDAVPLVVLPTQEVHVGQQETTAASPAPAVRIQITSVAEGNACCAPGCCG